MKRFLFLVISIVCFSVVYAIDGFRFALFTDLHIQVENKQPSEDLQRAIDEVNVNKAIEFVIVSGDISQYGDSVSLKEAKLLLDKLNVPYYITLGNHEVNWEQNQTANYLKVFGSDKFAFSHKGFYFIGFASKPIVKSGAGYILPADIDWVNLQLSALKPQTPIFAITHYPLLNGDVDNWYEMTDVFRKYNVQAVLGGHYHRNMLFNYDEIPGVICRSTLRAKDEVGGYMIFELGDEFSAYQKKIGQAEDVLLTLPIEIKQYSAPDKTLRTKNVLQSNEKYY